MMMHLPRPALIWLLVCLGVAITPHLSHLPPLLWLVSLVVVATRWQVYRGVWSYPGTWAKVGAIVAVTAGVLLSVSGEYSLESATAFFLGMSLLKVLEMRSQRDGYLVVFLALFLFAIGFLFEQGMVWAAVAVGHLWIALATMMALQLAHTGDGEPGLHWRVIRGQTTQLLLLSLPLMLVFYLLFPRLSPLWSMTLQSEQSYTGLSDTMSPGDIASLGQSDELAFRASFESGQRPPRNQLYWRALVLDEYDGRSWTYSRRNRQTFWYGRTAQPYQPTATDQVFDIIQEPTGERWLFSLRNGAALERGIGYVDTDLIRSQTPIFQRQRYRGVSRAEPLGGHPSIPSEFSLDAESRSLNLQLPDEGNPRIRQWVRAQQAAGHTAIEILQLLLQDYAGQFTYTLKPPVLGQHDIDEFLFDTRRGFCAHFAGAFVYAARLAGIPARVVTGYQGGEWNNDEGYLTVRQYDAHAWAELWIEGQGWQRYDPTAWVSPDRIELGLEAALRDEGSFMEDSLIKPGQIRDIAWLNRLRVELETINYLWHSWVLSYDRDSQRSLLSNWFGDARLSSLVSWMVAAMLVIMVLLSLVLVLRSPRRQLDPVQRQWVNLLRLAGEKGLAADSGVSPMTLIKQWRSNTDNARLQAHLAALTAGMDRHLYARDGNSEATRQTLMKQFKGTRRAMKRLPRVIDSR